MAAGSPIFLQLLAEAWLSAFFTFPIEGPLPTVKPSFLPLGRNCMDIFGCTGVKLRSF